MSTKRRVGVAALMAALGCMLFVPRAGAAQMPDLVAIEFVQSCSALSPGDTCQFVAVGVYSDSSTQDITDSVRWSSSHATVARVSNGSASPGLVSAVGSGSAEITATLQKVTASAPLTVGPRTTLVAIEVLPLTPTLPVGGTQQFTAIGVYSDGSTQDLIDSVRWSSSHATVARIDRSGLALGVRSGSAAITATDGAVSSQTQLTVI